MWRPGHSTIASTPSTSSVNLDSALLHDHRLRRRHTRNGLMMCGQAWASRRPALSGIGRQNYMLLLKVGVLRLFGRWGLLKSLELVFGRTSALPKPLVDALLVVFRNFRPRMERIPRFTDTDLAGLSMPVQVVVGSDDALLNSQETRERVQRHVRNASVTYVENAGHLLPAQTATVADFLTGIRRAAGVGVTTAAVLAGQRLVTGT